MNKKNLDSSASDLDAVVRFHGFESRGFVVEFHESEAARASVHVGEHVAVSRTPTREQSVQVLLADGPGEIADEHTDVTHRLRGLRNVPTIETQMHSAAVEFAAVQGFHGKESGFRVDEASQSELFHCNIVKTAIFA